MKKVLIGLVAIVAVIIIVSVAKGGGSSNNGAQPDTGAAQSSAPVAGDTTASPAPTTSTAPAADDPFTDKDWKVSDIQVDKGQFGTSISAQVTNQENKARTGIFTITIFSGGQRIADAQGSADSVGAGQTVTVQFVGTTDTLPGDPSGYTYRFQTDMTY